MNDNEILLSPYIGITGFTSPCEIEALIDDVPNNPPRKLMIGVVATYKSLRNIPMKPYWQKQTPDASTIRSLFFEDSRLLNLVHFSTEKGFEGSVLRDLTRLIELAGEQCHGFQLNMVWPNPTTLENLHLQTGKNLRIVLQMNDEAIENVGGTPEKVAQKLSEYEGLITDVLLDGSGGRGKPIEPMRAQMFLQEIERKNPWLELGAAGGLDGDYLHKIAPLFTQFPNLNIDAQGKLRNEENRLDIAKSKKYLTASIRTVEYAKMISNLF